MSQIIKEKMFHSLPKRTQPTLSSSAKFTKTSNTKQSQKQEICPQLSEFVTRLHYKDMYIHNQEIDYGRLGKPKLFYQPPQAQQPTCITDRTLPQQQLNMQTESYEGISHLNAHNTLEKQPKQTKNTAENIQNAQLTRNNRSLTSTLDKSKIRMKQVKAYQLLNKQKSNCSKKPCRIIKVMVAGGQTQTRLISYPDNLQYLKLCGLKRQ